MHLPAAVPENGVSVRSTTAGCPSFAKRTHAVSGSSGRTVADADGGAADAEAIAVGCHVQGGAARRFV